MYGHYDGLRCYVVSNLSTEKENVFFDSISYDDVNRTDSHKNAKWLMDINEVDI